MHSRIFSGWSVNLKQQKEHGITDVNGWCSWYNVKRHAENLSAQLNSNTVYFIEPNYGIDSIVALLAVAMTEGVSFIWGKTCNIKYQLQHIKHGIFAGLTLPSNSITNQIYYGSFSSGSTNNAKLPMGNANCLEQIGIHYDEVLLKSFVGSASDDGVIATCLPLEYSATLMLAIFPAWFACRDLIIFNADSWNTVLNIAAERPVVTLLVPSLLTTACVAIAQPPYHYPIRFLTTGGYLSSTRISTTQNYFSQASFYTCYGASEHGLLSINNQPEQSQHVGKVIPNKRIWLSETNYMGIGKINCIGNDCRLFYFPTSIYDKKTDINPIDYGHFDAKNNLYLDGRIDGSEKLNGLLIYPRQLEQHILSCNKVVDVKVNIISNKGNGSDYIETIVIGNVNEQQIQQHCATLLPHLRPKKITIYYESNAPYSSRGKL